MTVPTDSIKISQLTAASSSAATDEYAVNQGGVTKKINPSLLSTDYKLIPVLPSTIINNGQRSYDLTFLGVNYGSTLSPGMFIATQRTVASPNNSTNLNGTNQSWRNTSPNKLVFTDDFAIGGWVKLTSYPSAFTPIVSRMNGTSGWMLYIDPAGRPLLAGYNGAFANNSSVTAYQSLALNRWTYVSAQLDMSAFTATTTTSYIMLDGVDVPTAVARGGTNPTTLAQAGNLEVGSYNSGLNPFPGKIAQLAIFNAKVTQAAMRSYMSQGLTGSEPNLSSAYSFDNNANDLNTTTPNNLTAINAAGYGNDSPFGIQSNGMISSTLDYGIIMSVSGGANTIITVQVPEGCAIPTSGGISGISYTTNASAFGLPTKRDRWRIYMLTRTRFSQLVSNSQVIALGNINILAPVGSWDVDLSGWHIATSGSNTANMTSTMSISTSSSSLAWDGSTPVPATAYIQQAGTQVGSFSGNVNTPIDIQAAKPIYVVNSLAGAVGSATAYLDLSQLTLTNAYL